MFKIINKEELNSNANPEKAINGGGYSHPWIDFTFKGINGTLEDSSCGEFGDRYHIEWDGLHCNYDTVGNTHCYSEFSKDNSDHIQLAKSLASYGVLLFI